MVKRTEWPASTAAWAMFWAIIVLPRPWGATRTTLRASSRKSRREGGLDGRAVDALGPGPVEVGHGLEAAEAAAAEAAFEAAAGAVLASIAARCSRSWVGLQRLLVASATRSSSASAVWRRPRLRSCCSGARLIGSSLGGGEGVVGVEGVRRDAEVAHAGVGGQDHVERRARAAGAGALVEDVGDGGGAEGAAGERVGEGGVELGRAVPVEEPEQAGDWPPRCSPRQASASRKASARGQAARRRSRPRSSWARRFSRASAARWAGSSMPASRRSCGRGARPRRWRRR